MLLKEIDKNKKWVFYVLLLFTSFSGVLFAVLNYFRGQHLLASIEAIVSVVAVWLLIHLYRSQSTAEFHKLALIFIIMFLFLMMYAFTIDGVSISIFTFALAIPLLSYLLLGVKSGFIITAIFYASTAWIFFGGFGGHVIFAETVAYANIIVCALLYWGISHFYEVGNRDAKRKLREMAVKDHLTGLYNRTMLIGLFEEERKLAIQSRQQLAVVLFDLDKFKAINDDYGHDAGDTVLQQFAVILRQHLQNSGYGFRLGGEEFAVMKAVSGAAEVYELAESIRTQTQSVSISGVLPAGTVGVSGGVEVAEPVSASLRNMLKDADDKLYQAKMNGRNQVVKTTELG